MFSNNEDELNYRYSAAEVLPSEVKLQPWWHLVVCQFMDFDHFSRSYSELIGKFVSFQPLVPLQQTPLTSQQYPPLEPLLCTGVGSMQQHSRKLGEKCISQIGLGDEKFHFQFQIISRLPLWTIHSIAFLLQCPLNGASGCRGMGGIC